MNGDAKPARRRAEWPRRTFDLVRSVRIGDLFFAGGIGLLGYGLYLWRPWAGFAVTGAILTAAGLFSAWIEAGRSRPVRPLPKSGGMDKG